MSGKRRGPVGTGYMPKGGRAAAQAHNERVAASAAPAAPVPVPVPETAAVRTDVRASARSAWTWTDRVEVATIAAGVSVVVSLLAGLR